jgi:hypothetical protein
MGVDNTQTIVSSALFGANPGGYQRTQDLARGLMRSFTGADSAAENKNSSPTSMHEKNRKIISWSASSPLQGFDLQLRGRDLSPIKSYSHLMIKLVPHQKRQALLKKVKSVFYHNMF